MANHSICNEIMLIDTAVDGFNMQSIENRRFMYSPQTHELILGAQYAEGTLVSSHADEIAAATPRAAYDSFVRGWVGTGKNYPYGVIHFAPNIVSENVELFDRGFDTLEMFRENGALQETVVRGFGETWEQPLSRLLGLHPGAGIAAQSERRKQ